MGPYPKLGMIEIAFFNFLNEIMFRKLFQNKYCPKIFKIK